MGEAGGHRVRQLHRRHARLRMLRAVLLLLGEPEHDARRVGGDGHVRHHAVLPPPAGTQELQHAQVAGVHLRLLRMVPRQLGDGAPRGQPLERVRPAGATLLPVPAKNVRLARGGVRGGDVPAWGLGGVCVGVRPPRVLGPSHHFGSSTRRATCGGTSSTTRATCRVTTGGWASWRLGRAGTTTITRSSSRAVTAWSGTSTTPHTTQSSSSRSWALLTSSSTRATRSARPWPSKMLEGQRPRSSHCRLKALFRSSSQPPPLLSTRGEGGSVRRRGLLKHKADAHIVGW